MGHRPGVGGAAILVPWYDEGELAAVPEQLRPQFAAETIAQGRIHSLSIENPRTNMEIRIINIHNFELSAIHRSTLRHRWQGNATWARADEMHRLAIAIGDFN
eukprot:7153926-Pyramimonas_sp.AAC.1